MIKDFKNSADLTIREVQRADWPAYKKFFQSLKKPEHFSGYFQTFNIEADNAGDKFFDDMHTHRGEDFKFFGLFHKDKMIGHTSIRFTKDKGKDVAIFGGSEILDDYRGQRLVDIFYKHRKDYIIQTGFQGRILMTIPPNKTASQKAAARNGFIKTGKTDLNGYYILEPKAPFIN